MGRLDEKSTVSGRSELMKKSRERMSQLDAIYAVLTFLHHKILNAMQGKRSYRNPRSKSKWITLNNVQFLSTCFIIMIFFLKPLHMTSSCCKKTFPVLHRPSHHSFILLETFRGWCYSGSLLAYGLKYIHQHNYGLYQFFYQIAFNKSNKPYLPATHDKE